MAINFPSTVGQPTNGSYTYTVSGITYSWDGSSWQAAGAGASATDKSLFSVTTNSAGTPALSYDSNTGIFSYTPPLPESDTLATVTGRGASTTDQVTLSGGIQTTGVTFTTSGNGKLSCNGDIGANCDMFYVNNQNNTTTFFRASSTSGCILSDTSGNFRVETLTTGVRISGALTAGGLTYPTSNGSSGDVLTSDGSGNVTWQTPTGGGGGGSGLTSRTTASVTQSIANNGIANVSFTTAKAMALMKIETSHAAWVTLYSSTSARTNDAGRLETTDPTPGSGVLSEVITAGNVAQLITPATVCFNESGATTTYAKIVNKSGSTANVQVTLTYLQLEV
jgi:hypothetical protein|tara:strand:- start:64 stop:1074 length:1011 start_codon:yes stop_codon:yes gene_type:complete